MLCTKIRLKERRLVEQQQQQRLLLHDATNECPVVRRPCLSKNLLAADCITTATTISRATMITTTTTTTAVMIAATTNVTTITTAAARTPTAATTTPSTLPSTTTTSSLNDSANNKHRNSQQQPAPPPTKTPLILLTLSMSPETETLAPRNIKRDPRKQPSFCLNFKSLISNSISSNSGSNSGAVDRQLVSGGTQEDSLNFLIKGVEISERQINNNNNKNGTNEITGNNQNTNVDLLLDNDFKVIECTCDNEHKIIHDFMLNLDEYEMDTFGHLPGDSRTPTPSRAVSGICRGSLTAGGFNGGASSGTGLGSTNDAAYWLRAGNSSCRLQKQPSSPQTEQVIRITMNKK